MTNGMMGRLPDYMNAYAADLAAVRGLLGRHERSDTAANCTAMAQAFLDSSKTTR
jgi:hypothetical protein